MDDNKLQQIADKLYEHELVHESTAYTARGDIELEVLIPNPAWGLPTELHDAIRAQPVHIDDFSHINRHPDGCKLRLYLCPGE